LSAGFLKRNDHRLVAVANGHLSQDNYIKAAALDAVGSVASVAIAGRIGGMVTAKLGSGYLGYVASGAVAGGTFDATQQGSQLGTYQLTQGQDGRRTFSGKQLVASAAFGAVLGGAAKFGEGVNIDFSRQDGLVFSGENWAYRLRSPVYHDGSPYQLNSGLPLGLRSPLAPPGAAAERLAASGKITPASLGYSTISDSPETLKMWNDAMRSAASSSRENGYMRYLKALDRGENPDQKMLEDAFTAVNSRFVKSARAAGIDVAEVHHWNYGKTDYPTQIVDPRNLVMAPSREIHEGFHRATSSTGDIWGGPIDPRHEIYIDGWYTPLAPR